MIVSEIFIENKRLDISADISALLTFAIDDIKDFASRNSTFSKTIILPGTANNNFLFGHIFDAKISNPYDSTADNVATNFNASVSASCLMFQDHLQVFKGTLRLMEMVITDGSPEYEVAVFGELVGFIAAIGAGKLEDLDFSAYDHTWTTTQIINSWDNPPGSGYFYPLTDVGNVSQAKVDYDIKAFRPALYVKEYIDKIFEATSYTYESALFETDRFKRLVIPFTKKELTGITNVMLNETAAYGFGSPQTVLYSGTGIDGKFAFQFFTSTFFTPDASPATRATYIPPGPTNVLLLWNISINYFSDAPTTFSIKKNGVDIFTEVLPSTAMLPTSITLSEFTGLAETLVATDYLEVWMTGPSFQSYTIDFVGGSFTVQATSPITVPLVAGNNLAVNDCIPKNIKQLDFLSSIIKLFNLYVFEDRDKEKRLFIKPYADFFDMNVSGVVDWTYKLDRSRAIRLKPMSELNSRFYDFKFKEDSDFYNEDYRKRYNQSYGNRIFDSGFEFVNERTDINVIFSPSVLVGYTGVDKIVSVFYKQNAAGIEQEMDVNLRIFQTKKITGVTSWAIVDLATTLVSGLTKYGYGGHYDDPDVPANDIHFGVPEELFFILLSGAINVTQFNVYWSTYMAEITDKDSKLLIAHFKLTNKDIYDLDFSKFIHVDGSYWRLNKIADWNASEPDVCQCELLKLINMIY